MTGVKDDPEFGALVDAITHRDYLVAVETSDRIAGRMGPASSGRGVRRIAKRTVAARRAAATRAERRADVIDYPHGRHDPADHRIRWFACTDRCAEYPDGKMPRKAYMADSQFGWDVRCSCGAESHTGGAIAAYIRRRAEDHVRWGMDL